MAEGLQFTDGTVTLRWLGEIPSTVFHASVSNVERTHGHGGNTRVNWLD